ncbi:hypothetical protein QFZ75_008137 [Streptomyces sp. V3I8]|uniref:DUF6059 family protein n=1 Tax=Streptomyces sp. V3I8 TaxID=3042279 RepID=UPI00277F3536|nr:DUF6059 family protein [Streptomyces sp. V3I8]MDQ1041635.1 hypothetical protein [Streptomyces sp. V3I8]
MEEFTRPQDATVEYSTGNSTGPAGNGTGLFQGSARDRVNRNPSGRFPPGAAQPRGAARAKSVGVLPTRRGAEDAALSAVAPGDLPRCGGEGEMRQRLSRWLTALAKTLQQGLIALAEWNGCTPAFRHLLEQDTSQEEQLPDPAATPPGHPERLLPHVPPTAKERLLWEGLELDIGRTEQARNQVEDPGQ